MADVDARAEADRLIAYHSPISRALTDERTSLESQLIPVSAYIVTSAIEAYLRWPDAVQVIEAARAPEELGRAGHVPGSRINAVHLWSLANIYLVGRKALTALDPSAEDAERTYGLLRFWERAAMAYRHDDGTRQAWDAGGVNRPYPQDVVDQLLAATTPVDDEVRARIKRWNATLVSYLFLLYFDTRVGTADTGPWPLPDGRVLLLRDYHQLGRSDFWWSDVAEGVPYSNLTAAFVLDDVSFRVSDFGTSYTDPEDYLDRLVAFGLFTTDGGSLRPVPLDELEAVVAAVRPAQSAHYRRVAAMDRHEKIRCGAYVYFSFLRPFALAAGVADRIDWAVPRDIPEPVYELVSQLEGTGGATDQDGPYYAPLA